jgi:Tfp pilus assembly protein PilO
VNVLVKRIPILLSLYVGFLCVEEYQKILENKENLESRINPMEVNLLKKRKTVQDLKKYFKDIDEAKEKISIVANEFSKIQEKLPSEFDVSKFLADLKDSADRILINRVNFSPKDEKDMGFYYSRMIQVEMTATFLQMIVFLERIQNMKELINVENIRVSEVNEEQKGRYQLVSSVIKLETYRFNDKHSAEKEIKRIESGKKI